MRFIEAVPSQQMIEHVKELAEQMGALPRSITEGEGNFDGIMLEFAVAELLGYHRVPTLHYDLRKYPDSGRTIDTKTKRCWTTPKDSYDATTSQYNMDHQTCDRYVFGRSFQKAPKLWIVGWMDKQDFRDGARLIPMGHFDADNKWTASIPCYNMEISQLNEFDPTVLPADGRTANFVFTPSVL